MAITPLVLSLLRPAILGVAAIMASGCANHVDHMVVLRLRVSVSSHELGSVAGAAIWLRDLRFGERYQPDTLRNPVCVTSRKGTCSGVITYSYGSTSWPWSRYINSPVSLSERFELSVLRDGRLLVRRRLEQLTQLHVQGEQTLFVRIIL